MRAASLVVRSLVCMGRTKLRREFLHGNLPDCHSFSQSVSLRNEQGEERSREKEGLVSRSNVCVVDSFVRSFVRSFACSGRDYVSYYVQVSLGLGKFRS